MPFHFRTSFFADLRMIRIAVLAVFLTAGVFAAPAIAQDDGDEDYAAPAQGFTGFIGRDTNTPPPADEGGVTQAQPDLAPPALPPVFSTVRESAPHEEDTTPAVADPCADFTDSYDSYNICQDRVKKIERMRDAKNRRLGIQPAPAAPAPAPAESAKDMAKDATDKVEELEQKMKDKEAADAARRAAPTTKKGIGDFNRYPETSGNKLFR